MTAALLPSDLRYSITLWKGDIAEPLARSNIQYQIGEGSPSDAAERFKSICSNMEFIGVMDRFFQNCPRHVVVLRCSEKAFTVPQIGKVVSAYKKMADEHQQLVASSERSDLEFHKAVRDYQKITDPLLFIQSR